MKNITHEVNGIAIEQQVDSGFINATAMCTANGKEVRLWLHNKETYELFCVLNKQLAGIDLNSGILPVSEAARLSSTQYAEIFPGLITVKQGSPKRGGGTWLHPDLAIQLAQWCNPAFALQVSRWIREWMTTNQNPIQKERSQLSPVEIINLCSIALAQSSLSKDLQSTHLLRSIEQVYPESAPTIKSLLPDVQPKSNEEYVPPTRLAQIYNQRNGTNLKAYQINQTLEDCGYQTSYYTERTSTKTGKLKRTRCYSPTDLGSQYSTFLLDKAGTDKTVQVLRWKPSILEEISQQLGEIQ